MGKEKDKWLIRSMSAGAGIALLGVIVGWVSGFAIYASAYPIFQSQNWAAWVQAIGSIGAIAVAIWIGERQGRNSLEIYQADEASREAKEAEMYAQALYAVILMIWRLSSLIDAHFSTLQNLKLARPIHSDTIRIGQGRELYRYDEKLLDSFNQADYQKAVKLLDFTFRIDKSTSYIVKKTIQSLNGINLLSFPYAAIADQIVLYIAFYEGFLIKLEILQKSIKQDAGLTDEQVDNANDAYKALLDFANCGYGSALEINGFLSHFRETLK